MRSHAHFYGKSGPKKQKWKITILTSNSHDQKIYGIFEKIFKKYNGKSPNSEIYLGKIQNLAAISSLQV